MESGIPSSFDVKVYHPTSEQFQNFAELMRIIDKECHEDCFAKVIPPAEYRFESLNQRQLTKLTRVVEQGVSSIGAKSAFNLSYDKVQSMTYEQFVQRATEQDEKIGLLEVNQYEDMHWNSLIQRSSIDPNAPDPSTFIPLYSIDNPITLFPKKVKLWNLNNFTEVESLIHSIQKNRMPGILTPYLYLGMLLTSFGLHIEDSDLCSINYMHDGKPKVWYGIPFSEHDKLHRLAEKLFSSLAESAGCNFYIRHKTLMIPPSLLQANGIRFTRIVQYPGEFVISLSGGYHMGFNCGLNKAEAINFASNRWLKFYKNFKTCGCGFGSQNVVHSILRPIFEVHQSKTNAKMTRAKISKRPKMPTKRASPSAKTNAKKTTTKISKSPKMPTKAASSSAKTNAKKTTTKTSNTPKMPTKEAPQPAKPLIKKGFNCDKCFKSFTENKNLLAHQRLKHSGSYSIYKCPHCPTFRNSLHNFKTHLKTAHAIEATAQLEKFGKKIKKTAGGVDAEKQKELNKVVREILTCDICGRSVHGKFNLKRHLKEQHIEPARCKACERLFRGKYSLKRHEKEQHSTR